MHLLLSAEEELCFQQKCAQSNIIKMTIYNRERKKIWKIYLHNLVMVPAISFTVVKNFQNNEWKSFPSQDVIFPLKLLLAKLKLCHGEYCTHYLLEWMFMATVIYVIIVDEH